MCIDMCIYVCIDMGDRHVNRHVDGHVHKTCVWSPKPLAHVGGNPSMPKRHSAPNAAAQRPLHWPIWPALAHMANTPLYWAIWQPTRHCTGPYCSQHANCTGPYDYWGNSSYQISTIHDTVTDPYSRRCNNHDGSRCMAVAAVVLQMFSEILQHVCWNGDGRRACFSCTWNPSMNAAIAARLSASMKSYLRQKKK